MKLYNTLTKKVENFEPREQSKVNFFVCGPTVYDFSPISHAKTYVHMDTLARMLRIAGYDVNYLQNITDIDDKVIARANEQGITWNELGKQYELEYYKDMESLNITSVTYARATDYIDKVINQVQRLIDKGHAYKIDDGIYFEIATFPDYGKLSGRQEVKENDAQTRIDHSDEKRGWNDFCVWKFSKPGEPTWDAPFGNGRPGWHIEDTAITEHFFGPQYDIHGGAIDLIFPHHEAELTQMESLSGLAPFVKYWVHGGFLTIDGTRMGKSMNNFHTIREVLEKGYDPMVIRWLMLQSHYRSSVDFSWKALAAAQKRLADICAFADLRFQINKNNPEAYVEYKTVNILEQIENDLNTPGVLAQISGDIDKSEVIFEVNEKSFLDYIKVIDELLGLKLNESKDISPEQKDIVTRRKVAREAKDWQKSDDLRDELKQQGIGVRDTEHGPIWYRL